jgi:hypothetical protein
MPLNTVEINLIREKSRSRIESLENWLRRIIDEELRSHYGSDYINTKTSDESYKKGYQGKY